MALTRDEKLIVAGGESWGINGFSREIPIARLHLSQEGCVGVFTFASAIYLARENIPQLTVTVRRRGNLSAPVEVRYEIDTEHASAQYAKPGEDFILAFGTLSFESGVSEQHLEVTILDDAFVESTEDLVGWLQSPTGGAVLGLQRWTQIEILDDESAGTPGSVDLDFAPFLRGVAGEPSVDEILVQHDGKIVIAGSFTEVGGAPRDGLARLQDDGSVDPAFYPRVNGRVLALASSNGKLLVGGEFNEINGVPRSGLARLNLDGSLDANFSPSLEGTVIQNLYRANTQNLLVVEDPAAADLPSRFYRIAPRR